MIYKFRIYDTIAKDYIQDDVISNFKMSTIKNMCLDDRYVIESHFGKKDYNDKEIFEGDIVSSEGGFCISNDTDFIELATGVVVYDAKRAIFGVEMINPGIFTYEWDGEINECDISFYSQQGPEFSWHDLIIIGNIHQQGKEENNAHI
jgi:uncharacterized phage protein (TIGR01671 family)